MREASSGAENYINIEKCAAQQYLQLRTLISFDIYV